MDPKTNTRLNKYLATQLGISRREADELISKGKVSVNGKIAVIGERYQDGSDVSVNGKKVSGNTQYIYLLFNKPVGYICSRAEQGNTPTIYQLLPAEYRSLKTVGRLDKNSSGLIILTNDGDFSHRMTHPSFYKTKIYHVRLNHELAPLHQQMISDHGVALEDGVSQFQLERASDDNRKSWIVTMHTGRNRQIRRTFASLGYTVTKLHRTNFASYTLGDIKPGKFRLVNG